MMSKEILHSKDEILGYLGGIIPKGSTGLKTFKHRSGVDITVARGEPERLDEPAQLMVTLAKGFGRGWLHGKHQVGVEETYYFGPESDRVRRHDSVTLETLTGTHDHEIYELRDGNEDSSQNIDLNDEDSLSYRPVSRLVDLIKESTRVHPYTGESLPFDEETEIDRQMSAAFKAIDSAGRQVGAALREGLRGIAIDPSLDAEGNLHIDVNPKE